MLSAGTTLGPYEILSPLGAGGMGEVYRAKDSRLDREVAVKVLPDQTAKDPAALSRFQREAKAIAALSHANILAVFDVGQENGVSFVVTELLEGETLRDTLRSGRLSWRRAVEIGAAVVDGMAAAHAKGIIHRDLKPENIFITRDGTVKILDFGLARVETGPAADGQDAAFTPTITIETRPGAVLGTLNYMSPEQLRGRPVDARTDVFSFGCVLYEMISGQRAFHGETSADTMTAILREVPAGIRSTNADVGLELERIIDRCLEKKPEQRFHSASDLAFTLRAVLADSGPVTTQPERKERMWGFALPVAMAAIAVTALGIWGVARIWRSTSPADAFASTNIRSIGVLPFQSLSKDSDQTFIVDAITEAITDDLAKISALQVIASRTMMRYKSSTAQLREIAEELKLDAIVLGSALEDGERVEFRVRLVDGATERQLWSEHYESHKSDILATQREIARAVASEIKVKLTPSEKAVLAFAPKVNPQAYDAYVRGLEQIRAGTEESGRTALTFFNQALQLDPDLALAYVGRAKAFYMLGSLHMRPSETMPHMEEAARRALEKDASLADAHVVLGEYLMQYEWDWAGAEAAFKKALSINPNDSDALLGYAQWLSAMKRPDEAMEQIDRVMERDPAARVTNDMFGIVEFMCRRYERAITDAKEALKIDKEWWGAHMTLGLAYAQQGKFDDAIQSSQRAYEITGASQMKAMLGGVLAVAGRREEAITIRKELRAKKKAEFAGGEYVCPYEIATISIGLGDKDEAFKDIDEACEDRAECIPWLRADPRLDPLRDDPRFDDVLRRVGFEPQRRTLELSDKSTAERKSLAILPFANQSSDESISFLGDEVPASVIDRLATLPSLRVLPRNSSFGAGRTAKGPTAIGRLLDVDVVLAGQVSLFGDVLRIRAQLIDVVGDRELWAGRFDHAPNDLINLEDQIVGKIVSALRLRLSGEEKAKLSSRHTNDSEAYRAYLQGRFWWNKRTPDGFRKAIDYFRQAIDRDPNYALALTGLADTYTLQGVYQIVHPVEAARQARQAALAALRIDDGLAEAHVSMGGVYLFSDHDFEAAAASLLRAIEIRPDYATAYHWLAWVRLFQGRLDLATELLEQASQLDPLSPIIMTDKATAKRIGGNYSDAESIYRRALEQNPDFARARRELGILYLETGRDDEAIQQLERAYRDSGQAGFYGSALGDAYGTTGRTEQARDMLRTLKASAKTEYVSSLMLATIHASLGEIESAAAYLETAIELHDPTVGIPFCFPSVERYQDDPRIADVLRKVGHIRIRTSPLADRRRSNKLMLAVLPFDNLSRDPAQEYFSDGMTDEMITTLGRLSPDKLAVIARTSAMRYKGTTKGIDEIGHELSVDYVVEGTVRRSADRVDVKASLIDVNDQTQVWSDRFDGDLADVFKTQVDVAEAIADSLAVKLLPGRKTARTNPPTSSSAAYDAYLLGRSYWAKRTPESLRTAIEHFNQAVKLDPNYALAYAGLADAWGVMPSYVSGNYEEMVDSAVAAAEKAIALDDSLAESHASMANAFGIRGDQVSACEHLRQAVAIDPNNATAHQWYGLSLAMRGRYDQAVVEFEEAIKLDPLAAVMRGDYGLGMLLARRYHEAARHFAKALELDPSFYNAAGGLMWAHILQSDYDAAAGAFLRYLELIDQPESSRTTFQKTYATTGLPAAMLEWLNGVPDSAEQRGLGPAIRASLYGYCGEVETAYDWLNRAVERQDPRALFVEIHPSFDSLRDDPRYRGLVRRIGLKTGNETPQLQP